MNEVIKRERERKSNGDEVNLSNWCRIAEFSLSPALVVVVVVCARAVEL
jgi:hypothetical protein